jgi:hypothetical protein
MEKYNPLTQQEYIELRDFITSIGVRLPENKAHYVWSMFNRVRSENEPQPCTCASSGAHWKRAVDFLINWVNERR